VPAGRAHPREKLVAMLWDDLPRDRGRSALCQAILAIRKALDSEGKPSLVTPGDGVALNPDAVWVDVAEFESAAGEEQLASLESAAILYGGDFLAGLPLTGKPFKDWLTLERERLRERAIETLARLLAGQRRAGAREAAIQTALRLLALDPLQEPVHRTLMGLYVDLGRRAAALRQYQICVGLLQRELGVEPEPESRALFREILSLAGPRPGIRPATPKCRGPPARRQVPHRVRSPARSRSSGGPRN
jgi:DNA-binding SARP family transcriptional activator